jgi:putative iron-dependent peroxidase
VSEIPQAGIFALGTASHAYLELDLHDGADPRELVARLADLREPRTTIGGVSLVVGVRPSVWARIAGEDAPRDAADFDTAVTGPDGFSMPATQHDLWLWVSGMSPDVVFDAARGAIDALSSAATMASEVQGWIYQHDRDLTGFIDGTENSSVLEAPAAALVPDGEPGADSAILLVQGWPHDADAWEALGTHGQERAMGRAKLSGEELDPRPETAS